MSSCGRPSPLREDFVVAYSDYTPPRRKNAWSQLKEEVRAHDGPVVISSEVLCYLPTDLAEQFTAQLDADEVEVVAVRRRPSALVTSLHLQLMKLAPQPDFPDFARTLFAELPEPGRSPHEFIDLRTVVRHWSNAGAAVTVIDALDGLSDATVVETLEALTPGLTWEAPDEPSNVGMSGIGGQLWQTHCRANPPRYIAAAHSVRERMLQVFPGTTRGPKPRLTPAAAKALDDYCAGSIDTLPTLEPLVEPLPPADFDMDDALRRMRRWQQGANLTWSGADLAKAALGRGRIMKWPSGRNQSTGLSRPARS